MEGTIIKGKRMRIYLQDLVVETLGSFDVNADYFMAKTPMGLLIFNVVR